MEAIMNNKGISSIELLVSFVIIAFVAIGMFKAVFDILDKIDYYQEETKVTILKGGIINSIQKDLNQRKLYGYSLCGTNCYDITYQDLTTRRFKVDTTKKTIQYGSIAEGLPKGFDFTGNIIFAITSLSSPTNRNDSLLRIFIPISDASSGINSDINIVYQFDSRNMKNLSNNISVNAPVLANGMTPIKWNGTAWVDTTKEDMTWYSYDVSNKMWANARTADGSMWVWIPRYIYRISSGWHSNTSGTIDIQFSKGIDDNWNSSVIGNIDTGETSESSNNKWTNHPAFTFGTTELTGIWVAKFEASGTATTIAFKPNATSLRNININDLFTASRDMETNTSYGWGTSGNGIDTHLMKNVEWGAVAYLSKSGSGKTDEIWINPSNNYMTGCAGDSASSAATTGCLRTYDTANGVNASTTGNIYGIYDMSGGVSEYVAAYVDNFDMANYSNNLSLRNADIKYKDVYTPDPSEGSDTNYALAINKKGDAVYETSKLIEALSYSRSWYGGLGGMPETSDPLFTRGYEFSRSTEADIFEFSSTDGSGFVVYGFRATLAVGNGL
jgi:hypothetical protein